MINKGVYTSNTIRKALHPPFFYYFLRGISVAGVSPFNNRRSK